MVRRRDRRKSSVGLERRVSMNNDKIKMKNVINCVSIRKGDMSLGATGVTD
jgi:hypothetical protein